jgi:hypothetical protein
MNFINLTPHEIRVNEHIFKPAGEVARCKELSKVVHNLSGIELISRTYGRVENLPEPAVQTMYIVSALVRLAVPERLDVVSPGDLIRDDAGNIVGCKNLVMNKPEIENLFTSIHRNGETNSFQINKR